MVNPSVTGADGRPLGLDNFPSHHPETPVLPSTPEGANLRLPHFGLGISPAFNPPVDPNLPGASGPGASRALFHIGGAYRDADSLIPAASAFPPTLPPDVVEEIQRLRSENQRLKQKDAVQVPSGSSSRRRHQVHHERRDPPPQTQYVSTTRGTSAFQRLGPPCRIDEAGGIHYIPTAQARRSVDRHTERVLAPENSATASSAHSQDRRPLEVRQRESQAGRVRAQARREAAGSEIPAPSGSQGGVANFPRLHPDEQFEVSQGGRTLHIVNARSGVRRNVRLGPANPPRSPPRAERHAHKRRSPERSLTVARDDGNRFTPCL